MWNETIRYEFDYFIKNHTRNKGVNYIKQWLKKALLLKYPLG